MANIGDGMDVRNRAGFCAHTSSIDHSVGLEKRIDDED